MYVYVLYPIHRLYDNALFSLLASIFTSPRSFSELVSKRGDAFLLHAFAPGLSKVAARNSDRFMFMTM